MWRKDDPKTQEVPEISTGSVNSTGAPPAFAATPRDNFPKPALSARAIACISQGIKIRGDIFGNEDLFIDGEVEGKLDLAGAVLTIGPNGRVKAEVSAREVIVRGRVDGKITGRERVQIWSTGRIEGEVHTERLAIEDGAVLRGKVEAGKEAEKPKDAFASRAKPHDEKPERASAISIPAAPAAD
jgi:cytoskeletal protein CcmA (bactofilin family)